MLRKFIFQLEEHGDMFFGSGNDAADLKMVQATLNAQGYWAGTGLRYFFNDAMDLIKVEERRFGS